MLLLSIYFIGFAIGFIIQWRLPEGIPYRGKEIGAAFGVGIAWFILLPLLIIKYLVNIAGYGL